jgi:CheY-like chemotaxis protein
MSNPRILIVDDEEALLKVLSDSLKGMKTEYELVTATDGLGALEHLKKDPFDLVVTDYRMAGMDGLELLESIRSIRPKTRVVMMTAYGTDELQAETRRLQAYRFLTKPMQINTFRQVVEDALSDIAISRPGILILSDERYREVIQQLEVLQGDIGTRSIFLADIDGHVIAHIGDEDGHAIEQISSLLGAGMATLIESGRVFDKDNESINLAYREGPKDCLYAINIGEQLLLILILDNGPYASRIGSVWFYAQRAAQTLRQTLGDADYASTQHIFDETTGENLQKELDGLFDPGQDVDANTSMDDPLEDGAEENNSKPDALDIDEDGDEDSEEKTSVITFDEAMQTGIIPKDSFDQ